MYCSSRSGRLECHSVNWNSEQLGGACISYSTLLSGTIQSVENTSGYLLDSLLTLLQSLEDLGGLSQDMMELESQLSSMTTSTDTTSEPGKTLT